MSKAHDEFSAAFDRFLDEVGIADAMSVATGMFVSLVVGQGYSWCSLPDPIQGSCQPGLISSLD